ncbi:hypothetical protein [Tessaracoccus flavescens]|uniref:hypothetical protein n=1 Tax=Tessaracoccus flavescens TaxID=399497 RepID=UPI00126022E6|nr:hypothetical protein [Tessaracoccus flavescens]
MSQISSSSMSRKRPLLVHHRSRPSNVEPGLVVPLQRYNAEEPEATAFVESVSKLDQGSIEIKLDAVDYTTQDLEETTIQLFEDHALAEEVFGSVPQEIGYTDQGLDVTLAEGAPLPRRSSESLLGVPTTVRVATEEPPTSDGWQTSGADQSPWTGGSAINSGTGLCTSGFTWDKWTTREKMGSTAEHCYQLASPQPATQTWKTPPGTTVGNRYFFNIAADTQLIRAASGTSFRPRVWVGYNDPRTVKEYKSSVPATQVVALYGRTSGYHSTTVLGHFPRTMLDGSTTVLARTNSNVCQPGDSGGPWFYARGDGNIVAVGQHVGEWSRCEFVQIGTISASLSASVYLG